MIGPADIRKKAERRYRNVLRTCLEPQPDLFPLNIPFRKPGKNDALPEVIEWVRRLRGGSKETVGHGYTVEWSARRSGRFGSNEFPDRIVFETADDLLRFIGKVDEFREYERIVTMLRGRFPALGAWLRREIAATLEILRKPGTAEGLVAVCEFLVANPRCGLFARELPVAVDTKFVERHRSLLRKWLDLVLPPGSIDSLEENFEPRFGLGYSEPLVELRCLDPDCRERFGFPTEHFALPLSAAAGWRAHPEIERVVITENRINFLTLPRLDRTIALGGLGGGAGLFRHLHWLRELPISYWGDIDAHGFGILARLRRLFPQVESIVMDRQTVEAHRDRIGSGEVCDDTFSGLLTDAEKEVFEECRTGKWRLEQEKISQEWVVSRFAFANQ